MSTNTTIVAKVKTEATVEVKFPRTPVRYKVTGDAPWRNGHAARAIVTATAVRTAARGTSVRVVHVVGVERPESHISAKVISSVGEITFDDPRAVEAITEARKAAIETLGTNVPHGAIIEAIDHAEVWND